MPCQNCDCPECDPRPIDPDQWVDSVRVMEMIMETVQGPSHDAEKEADATVEWRATSVDPFDAQIAVSTLVVGLDGQPGDDKMQWLSYGDPGFIDVNPAYFKITVERVDPPVKTVS